MSVEPVDPRVERTRAHVLAHARRLLADHGPTALTYSALAAQARVTRQTLYRHWPQVDRLFADLVLERAVEEVRATGERLPPQRDVSQTITAFLHQVRDSMDDPANAGPLTALIAHADFHEASHRAMSDVVAGVRDELNALLSPCGIEVGAEELHRLLGPLMFCRFFARDPITDTFISELAASWVRDRDTT